VRIRAQTSQRFSGIRFLKQWMILLMLVDEDVVDDGDWLSDWNENGDIRI